MGGYLDQDAPAPPTGPTAPAETAEAWHPFQSRTEFDFAYHHYVKAESSASEIQTQLDFWSAICAPLGSTPRWQNEKDMYRTIDKVQVGGVPWHVYKIRYQGPIPANSPPKWMTQAYELCVRDARAVVHEQLRSSDFKDQISYLPYRHFNHHGKRVFSNLMSGEWAWQQANTIAEDPETHGSMFVPIVAGSDKTTVSVASGHQEYHPVYMSPGNLTNTARRGHGSAVLPVAFLPIPRAKRRQREKPEFKRFCRQLYHEALRITFAPLAAHMITPDIVKCPDGHFRRAIYGLGPYIADYPEQVWLSAVVSNWCPKCDAKPSDLDSPDATRRSREKTDAYCSRLETKVLWTDFGIRDDYRPFMHSFPRADIHQLLAPDLLHQVIKGTFKDHVVEWVNQYILLEYGRVEGEAIIDDIDRRISAVPPFPGLRRFPDGRDFHQWTGDDSKALMKVYLPAIAGYVPSDMVKCLRAFLEFCYTARRNSISADDLTRLQASLDDFHHYRQVFIETGVRMDTISLPRQHALSHYIRSITLFGSPNGLCSSITESKHIVAVKKPWRRSSRYHALSQMLTINLRIDKLRAAREVFAQRGMMEGTTASYEHFILSGGVPAPPAPPPQAEDPDDDDESPIAGPKVLSSIELARRRAFGYPRYLAQVTDHVGHPRLPELIQRFLYDQLNPNCSDDEPPPLHRCPTFSGRVDIFHSAVARFWSPSDFSGIGGMRRERIRSHPNWRGEYDRRDTVFIDTNADESGMRGMMVGRVFLFFSFKYDTTTYRCALIQWMVPAGDRPDEDTGLWVVRPEFLNGRANLAVISLDSISRAAHLIGTYGRAPIPEDLEFHQSLDAFRAFYVNRYVDHHSHEFLQGDE
ncbi:hypothetical protein CONPUDRAFT_130963 [Coniophora puteana RWD-64-598 SS2]|uniref:Uncharacterized protein n=1 Tax=Coniophora puteana (strain RWD-64-598) TaxID=741705 RepID=A0A5M3MCK0_CONPW|nr:uncharacterized protein CONPUDRAFT_130963 [Coniophora puteana RWD-64-598 SS2]EIW76371.1 hypothetical protein CONPUDRAFT_130963 [Coniophora puteana RWD-64-598 SS2]